jgi:hypothetical protein
MGGSMVTNYPLAQLMPTVSYASPPTDKGKDKTAEGKPLSPPTSNDFDVQKLQCAW